MAIRFAAASALALATALTVAAPARAQGLFSFYEVSPRQVVNMLEDDGYSLQGPMMRRGDVYVVNVVSVSGRSARLVVDARDGHILERYATRTTRWRDSDAGDGPRFLRPPRDVGDADRDDAPPPRNLQQALGDLFNPPSRVYGNDSVFPSKPAPDAAPTTDFKPKHHAVKKHKEPSVAKAPAATPSPDESTAPKPDASSVAAVAPSAPAPDAKKPLPDLPKGDTASKGDTSAKLESAPKAEPAPKPEIAPKPDVTPKSEAAPKPKPEPVQTKAEVEKAPAAEPKPAPSPKAQPARKKLNDLPVGTLD